jgi:hypothetical protein
MIGRGAPFQSANADRLHALTTTDASDTGKFRTQGARFGHTRQNVIGALRRFEQKSHRSPVASRKCFSANQDAFQSKPEYIALC